MNGHDGRLPIHPTGHTGQQAGPQGVVMHHVGAMGQGVSRGQEGVADGIQVFGGNTGQPTDAHTRKISWSIGGAVVGTAVDINIATEPGQPGRELGNVFLNPAVDGRVSLLADHGHAKRSGIQKCSAFAGQGQAMSSRAMRRPSSLRD